MIIKSKNGKKMNNLANYKENELVAKYTDKTNDEEHGWECENMHR